MGYSIAIDGPAGAGKSTIARAVARRLGFEYIDTGAMYRTMGLYCHRHGVDTRDEGQMARACKEAKIQVTYENGVQQMWLEGENVSAHIRTEAAGRLASDCATSESVRRKLVELQREMAERISVVMDGRDIGTVVLPQADLKVFLTASVETRAERRYKELTQKGESCSMESIMEEMKKRDYQDTHRAISPLVQAEDAVYLDSSALTPEQVEQKILELYESRKK